MEKSGINFVKRASFIFLAWLVRHAKCPEWELVIAGPDQVGQQANLQTLATRLGVAEKSRGPEW